MRLSVAKTRWQANTAVDDDIILKHLSIQSALKYGLFAPIYYLSSSNHSEHRILSSCDEIMRDSCSDEFLQACFIMVNRSIHNFVSTGLYVNFILRENGRIIRWRFHLFLRRGMSDTVLIIREIVVAETICTVRQLYAE